MRTKKTVVIIVMLCIAICFVVGADWAGETAKRLFHSYFADIAIPCGYYLLLVLLEEKYGLWRKWQIKAGAVFLLCALSEVLQYFGMYALATVFDVLDFLMYALGVSLGVFLDRIVFRRMFGFWN